MAKSKILILTSFSEFTNHTRLNYEKKILENAGYYVDCFYGNKSDRLFIINIAEKIFLKFINLNVLFFLRRNRKKYDIYFLYGVFTLNTLLFFSPKFRKKCIYQTLNHDISYHTYELEIRIKSIKYFSHILISTGISIEKYLARSCGRIIVNSESLKEIFTNSVLIYYSSPLEGVVINHSPSQQLALVYLGQLRREKISLDFFDFIEKESLMFFVFGKIKDTFIKEHMHSSKYCQYKGDYDINHLKKELMILSHQYNLLGVSLIQEPHKSYKFQNANKDIDYMALGIPILGNYRKTTRELIEQGNGFFYDKFDVKKLAYDEYKLKSENCQFSYRNYSNANFEDAFLRVFKSQSGANA